MLKWVLTIATLFFYHTSSMTVASGLGTRRFIASPGVRTPSNPLGDEATFHGYKLKKLRDIGSAGYKLIELDTDETNDHVFNNLRMKGVDIEQDHVYDIQATIPDDTMYNNLWALPKISAPEAWDIHTGNQSVLVCVVDTGIDYNHNDLKSNIHSKGYNAISDVYDSMDDNGHGTHCAGTIAGVGNNGVGVVGVTWATKLVGCKFLSSTGNGYTSDAVECIRYCRQVGAQITSNSWGGGGFSRALYDEIKLAQAIGQLFAAAAGNNNQNIDSNVFYPASYDLDSIVVVGATNQQDVCSPYSNYGTLVDLSAPGDEILSTTPNNNYAYYSGTSMATPHVAGAAALIMQKTGNHDFVSVKKHILDGVDKVSALSTSSGTGGRLNVYRALTLALAIQPPSPTQQPKCCKYRKSVCIRIC